MKTTARLYDILVSELNNIGLSEFTSKNKNHLIFDSLSDETFYQKISKYDKDVEEIVNKRIFKGLTLEDEKYDKYFKRLFVNTFLNREIGYQTLDLFANKVSSCFITNENILNTYFSQFNEYLSGKTESDNTNVGNSTSKSRLANQDLPQDQINLDLNDDTFEYATNNSISKNEETERGNQQSTSTSKNIDNLIKVFETNLLEKVLNDFDRKCFLQIW